MRALSLTPIAPTRYLLLLASFAASAFALRSDPRSVEVDPGIVLSTPHVRYEIARDGTMRSMRDTRNGSDRLVDAEGGAAAWIRRHGQRVDASHASRDGERLTFGFGSDGAHVVLRLSERDYGLVFELESVSDPAIDIVTWLDVAVAAPGARGDADDPFAVDVLPLNERTEVDGVPGVQPRLRLRAHRVTGFIGAGAVLVAGPGSTRRERLQRAVAAAPGLPASAVGGPWALDSRANYGSYLFNFRGLGPQEVDGWIALARALGIGQIMFHTGESFRHGDLRPDPATYPQGLADVKTVVDRLHEAGILAGIATHSFYIGPDSAWVTPVPDPDLATDLEWTLAESIDSTVERIPLVESTAGISTVVGPQVRNSVTVRIDDELIVYETVADAPPFALLRARRGAYGTQPAEHVRGAAVRRLRECFGKFLPAGGSRLFERSAERLAETVNRAGFDAIYFDALDGADVVGGPELAWHHAAKFVFDVARRLDRPTIMEMSTMSAQLWTVRSRMGAWDHPVRGYKRFVDAHVAANADIERMLLPTHLGWWAFRGFDGPRGEPTFPDDVEYLMARALATDSGISIMGVEPQDLDRAGFLRLASIVERYEALRQGDYFDDEVKARLGVPGDEYALEQDAKGEWLFRRVRYERRLFGGTSVSRTMEFYNPFETQPLQLRLEALDAVGAAGVGLVDFAELGAFVPGSTAEGVQADLIADESADPRSRVRFVAASRRESREGAWACLTRRFDPPLDLSATPALGLWVEGDARGELLDVQWTSPSQFGGAVVEHYVPIDFAGWRFVELVEPEATRWAELAWPHGDRYSIFRELPRADRIEALTLCLNRLPRGDNVSIGLGAIVALPLSAARIERPAVRIGRREIVFPVSLERGETLEFRSTSDGEIYGPDGTPSRSVRPNGRLPRVESGSNEISIGWTSAAEQKPRGTLTLITRGAELRGKRSGASAAADQR